jgi:carboxypeptidase PM20D1
MWMASLAVIAAIGLIVVIKTLSYPWRAQVEAIPAKHIDLDQNTLARHLAEAIRFRTVSHEDQAQNDTDQLIAFREWLENTYPVAHQKLKREIVNDFSLLYQWPGSDSSLDPVILLAHIDVVPVDPASEDSWAAPPFEGAVSDGYIWGRGTLDMKSPLVGIMEAIEHELAQNHRPKRTIIVALGHDEEVGGRDGAANIARLLKDRGVHAEWVIDEGSAVINGVFPGLQSPAALIGVAEKGFVTLELIARGSDGHASMPPYDSAVTRLARAITKLQENPLSSGVEGTASEMFAALGPSMPFYARIAIANQWLLSPFFNTLLSRSPALNAILRTTIAPTMLVGSLKSNVLPNEAKATVNLRIHPRDTVQSVLENVRSLFSKDPDVRVEVSAGSVSDPSRISSTNSQGYSLVERTAREIFPEAIVSPYLVIAATDSRHYSDIAKDIYRFGPFILNANDLDRLHGIDERLSVEGLADVVRFYIRLIENISD